MGSEKLQSEKLIEEIKDIDRRFGLKTPLGRRRTGFSVLPDISEELSSETLIEKEPITVVCSDKLWLRALKGHQEPSESVKYKEGDRERFWIKAETTDKLMLFATDGRFFTLECSKLPGGRGFGDPLRDHIDLPPEADIVTMFVHRNGRKLLLAAISGHGFVTAEDDAVAMTRSGKKVMNVPPAVEAAVCAFVEGETVAVVGENRKLLIFPLEEVPELGRGRGVRLQHFKDGGLSDAGVFEWKQGLTDSNGRTFTSSELKEYRGARAQAGRIVPRGFSKALKFV